MAKKYKRPSDYPQFAFRLSKADKEKLLKQIEAIHITANKDRDEGDFKVNKNEIILEALQEGLQRLKKRKKWKSKKV